MDYSVVAKQILEKVGGESNVASVTHCMTRLRFVLKNEELVDDGEVKAIPGVAGVMKKAGQYQIIIGNDVAKCYQELTKLGSFNADSQESAPKKKQNPLMALLDVITGCMAPIIPAIIGAGMIKVLIIILGLVVSPESQTMQLLTVMGDCAYYFLPMLIAFSAAKKFNTNPYMVAAVAGVLLHPQFMELVTNATEGVRFCGVPVMSASYSSTIIPIMLTAWSMSYIEKFADRITPVMAKNFLRPALILLISAPVAFIILGPLGSLLGNGLASVIYAIQGKFSVLAMILMSAAMPFIVMTGMHWAFVPVALTALATPAGDTILLPAMLASNLAQGAACVAVALKSKDSNMKQIASASGFSTLFAGITEPGMYGVTIPLKRPMIAACIASGITGALVGFAKLSSHAFATPALISLPQFIDPARSSNMIFAVAAAVLTMVISFVLTIVLGFEGDGKWETAPAQEMAKADGPAVSGQNPAQTGEACNAVNHIGDGIVHDSIVYAPITGEAVLLSQVDDPTFATEILGKGLAVIPEEGKVYAPFNGEVVSVFDTKHALGMRSDSGIELLIHVGLETVRLNGKYFTAHVKNGSRIKKGDLMLEFDLEALKAEGYDTVTPILVSNTADYAEILSLTGSRKQAGEAVIKVI